MKAVFGKSPCGKEVYLYTLKNKNGVEIQIANYGGIVHSLKVPDVKGGFEDILLGFNDFNGYLSPENPYFNCIIGRVGNRLGNAKFTLNGKEYKLAVNDGKNHLHGGIKAFDKVVWDVKEISTDEGTGLELSYYSPDGEENYPGNLQVKVTYILTDQNEFKIKYLAETDQATPVNLTHHAYFNLCGNTKRDVLEHEVQINASKFTEVDANLIPTGTNPPVEGTAFDFRKVKNIGKDIKNAGMGYDHNFVIDGEGLRKIAEVIEPVSKRKMEVFSTSIGVQFYTGNFLNEKILGKKANGYQKHDGFCLETQYFPDSPNIPSFPSCILQPGQKFEEETIFRFSIATK
jgi:aldose 1-epimerase